MEQPDLKEPVFFQLSDGTECQLLYIYDDCDECGVKEVKTGELWNLPYFYHGCYALYSKVALPEDQPKLDRFWNKFLNVQ